MLQERACEAVRCGFTEVAYNNNNAENTIIVSRGFGTRGVLTFSKRGGEGVVIVVW